jgi:hypothetical protein
MSGTVEVHAQNAVFLDGLRLLFNQKTSRLRSVVSVEAVSGERQAFDSLGANRLIRKTSRNITVPVTETARFRRWMEQKDYWNSERFDGFDALRTHTDPMGRLAQAWASGAAREWDRCAVDAALGVAKVDKYGDTAVSLPASQVIAHGGTGLTLQKVKQAVKMLRRVNPDRDDPISFFVTSEQEDELLNSAIVTSADYNRERPLVDGALPFFMGAFFHTIDDVLNLSNPVAGQPVNGSTGTFDPILPLDTTATPGTPVRRCIAMLQSGVIMGELLPITTEINPAKEYGIYSQQLQVEMSVGGTREHESKVVVIECVDNSPTEFA